MEPEVQPQVEPVEEVVEVSEVVVPEKEDVRLERL